MAKISRRPPSSGVREYSLNISTYTFPRQIYFVFSSISGCLREPRGCPKRDLVQGTLCRSWAEVEPFSQVFGNQASIPISSTQCISSPSSSASLWDSPINTSIRPSWIPNQLVFAIPFWSSKQLVRWGNRSKILEIFLDKIVSIDTSFEGNCWCD